MDKEFEWYSKAYARCKVRDMEKQIEGETLEELNAIREEAVKMKLEEAKRKNAELKLKLGKFSIYLECIFFIIQFFYRSIKKTERNNSKSTEL